VHGIASGILTKLITKLEIPLTSIIKLRKIVCSLILITVRLLVIVSAGLLGSSAALNNVQTSASNIMQSDRQQYLDSLMQKYMASIGIGQNLYGVGATAGNQASSNALNQGQNQAGLTYGANAAPGAMFGKLAGAGADLGINWATGGASGLAKAATNMFGGNS
jgi:hypothetical protein